MDKEGTIWINSDDKMSFVKGKNVAPLDIMPGLIKLFDPHVWIGYEDGKFYNIKGNEVTVPEFT